MAFIERGTLPDERVVETTLCAVAAGEVEVRNPAVFVIGEVVRVHIADALIVDGMVDIRRARPLARLGYMDFAVVAELPR